MSDLAVPLVQRAHPAETEHNDRHDEPEQEPLVAVAERMRRRGRTLRATRADQKEHRIAGIASEWIDSAGMEEEPVAKNHCPISRIGSSVAPTSSIASS